MNFVKENEPSVEFFIVKVNGVPKYAMQSLSAAYEIVKTMPVWEIYRYNINGEDIVSIEDDGVLYSTNETANGEM